MCINLYFQKLFLLILIGIFCFNFSYAESTSNIQNLELSTKINEEQFDKKHNLKKGNLKAKWVSEEDEILFGNYVDAYIVNQFIVLENSSIVDAIKEIGTNVAKSSDRPNLPYTFKVLNSADINAFAGPGGYVYITTGLLDILETKEEVAAILAHEIGHVCERHSIRTLQNATNTNIIGGILSLVAAVTVAAYSYDSSGTVNPDLSNAAGQVGYLSAVIVNQGYTRAYENKADELGVIYLDKAGYDPKGMESALNRLLEVEKNKESGIKYTLFSTHPPFSSRISRVKQIIKKSK